MSNSLCSAAMHPVLVFLLLSAAASPAVATSYTNVEAAVVAMKLHTFDLLATVGGITPTLLNSNAVNTVFLPSEKGWADLCTAIGMNLTEISKTPAVAAAIVKYHIVPNRIIRKTSISLTALLTAPTSLATQALQLGVVKSGLVKNFYVYGFNGTNSTVLRHDIYTLKGVIHTLDKALIPSPALIRSLRAPAPSPTPSPTPSTVASFVASRPELQNFSSLVAAAKLTDLLNVPATMTLFAPNNDAIAQAAKSMGFTVSTLLTKPTSLLQSIVNNVVVPSLALFPSDLKDLASFTTRAGQKLLVHSSSTSISITSSKGAASPQSVAIPLGPAVLYIVDGVLLGA